MQGVGSFTKSSTYFTTVQRLAPKGHHKVNLELLNDVILRLGRIRRGEQLDAIVAVDGAIALRMLGPNVRIRAMK